jgi:hypothetical protein
MTVFRGSVLLLFAATAQAAGVGEPGARTHLVSAGFAAVEDGSPAGLLGDDKLQFDGRGSGVADSGELKLFVGVIVCGAGVLILLDALIDFLVASRSYAAGDAESGDDFRGLGYLALAVGSAAAGIGLVLAIWGLVARARWQDALKRTGVSVSYRMDPHATAPIASVAVRF